MTTVCPYDGTPRQEDHQGFQRTMTMAAAMSPKTKLVAAVCAAPLATMGALLDEAEAVALVDQEEVVALTVALKVAFFSVACATPEMPDSEPESAL